MGKRFLATVGTVTVLNGLDISNKKAYVVGVDPMPPGFKTPEELEAKLLSLPSFGRWFIEIPDLEKEKVAEAAKHDVEKVVVYESTSLYVCPFCTREFKNMEDLRLHMAECPILEQDLKERVSAANGIPEKSGLEKPEALIPIIPLNLPDPEEEEEKAAIEASIREEQKRLEDEAKAAKKAKNAEIYGKKAQSPKKTAAPAPKKPTAKKTTTKK